MKPATDVLYQAHQLQAERHGQSALARGEFCARLPATYETDLTGLLVPRPGPTVQIKVLGEPKFQLGQVCITPNAAQALPASEVLAALARHAAGDWGGWTITTNGKTTGRWSRADGSSRFTPSALARSFG